jgi:hypothetical protein
VQPRMAVVETTGGPGKTVKDLIKLATTRANPENNRSSWSLQLGADR